MLQETASGNASPERGLVAFISRVFSRRTETANSRRRRDVSASRGPRQPKTSGYLNSPKRRLLVGLPAGILVVVGVVVSLGALKGGEAVTYDNGIWLDRSWTHGGVDDARIGEFAGRLKQNQIGRLYAYASTLNIQGRWTGGTQGKGGFMESRGDVADFVKTLKERHQEAAIYGWIEIWSNLDPVDGYRLDSVSLHENVCRLQSPACRRYWL